MCCHGSPSSRATERFSTSAHINNGTTIVDPSGVTMCRSRADDLAMAAFPRFRSTRCSAIHRRDLRQAVILARARGASWKEIGDVLHLTPEEVAKRYARSPWQA